MTDRVPASGSCIRCRRALGLTAAKVEGAWYGTATCALGGECSLESRAPAVEEEALYSRPRRFFRRRRPKELKLGS
jgi:hypothetical protein